ncbi:hypothetical protein J4208_01865 [Candidatus Woesearchaeota archaeon]|nr:hypothetical protein [Candidatus Woesearchaeota archaeon]
MAERKLEIIYHSVMCLIFGILASIRIIYATIFPFPNSQLFLVLGFVFLLFEQLFAIAAIISGSYVLWKNNKKQAHYQSIKVMAIIGLLLGILYFIHIFFLQIFF